MTRHRYVATERHDGVNPELDAMVVHLRAAIGQLLDQMDRAGIDTLPEPVILAGARTSFAPCHLPPPEGAATWCVIAASRLQVARRWLDAGRAPDAGALLSARCDAGALPLVFLFADGTVSLSNARIRTGDVA